MSADFLTRLGWAAGRVLCRGGRGEVLIGKDTRLSGYMIESALEAGLIAAGVNVRLLGPLPTPGIAYLTRAFGARAGVVISASHNPFEDNGVKLFGPDGRKLDDDTEAAIEAMLDEALVTVEAARLGAASRVNDASGRYIEFCKNSAPAGLRLEGMRVVVDCAHGAAYRVGPAVFEELGAEVIPVGVDPDGCNINAECGSTAPEAMRAAVVEHGAHFGVALDGDADRVVMVDETGTIRDGDELLFVIANGRHAAGRLRGPVVGTVMSNLGLEQALKDRGIDFERAKVGDRYVLERLDALGGIIGGEASGHIICLDRCTTGDGLVSALQVVAEMVAQGASLAELCRPMRKFPHVLSNVRVDDKAAAMKSRELARAVSGAEKELGENGRVLVRASGTEALIRVMVEGKEENQVRRIADELSAVVQQAAGGEGMASA
jgi:phosphoglucosamine mutase